MKKIIYIFLYRRVTSWMIFVSVLLIGIISFYNIPIELMPQVEHPRLSVSAAWQNASPETVEAFLTSPMESVLSSVKGLNKISSQSSEGRTIINMEFHPSTEMNFARLEINEKLGTLVEELPFGVTVPRISSYVPKEFRDLQGFITYNLSAKLSSNEIRKYAVENFINPLLTIDGVSDVKVKGGNERELLIVIDYDKAKSFNINIDDITFAINNAEQIIPLGAVKKSGMQIFIKIDNNIKSSEFLLETPIKSIENSHIRLKDIGVIIDDFKENQGYFRINGIEAVFIEISKEHGKNSIEVADKVFSKIKELESKLPKDFILKKEIDMSEKIRYEIGELYKAASYSIVLILIVLFLIFRKISYSLIIIISIFFSLLFTFILFYIFEIYINILTIASLVLGLGLMVDNSIIIIDYLDKHYNGKGIKYLTVNLNSIFLPVLISTLTTISVFIPLIFLTGELKLYFIQFALSIGITLSASLIISFTLLPILFLKFGKAKNKFNNKRILLNFYIKILQKLNLWKKRGIIFLFLIIGLPVWLLPSKIETPILSVPYNAVFDSETYDNIKEYINYAFGGSLNLFFNHIRKGEVFSYGETDYIVVMLQLPNGNHIEKVNDLSFKLENKILKYKDNIDNITANVLNEETAILRINFNKNQSNTIFPYILKNYISTYLTKLGGLQVSVFGYGPGFSSGTSSISSFNAVVTGFNYNYVKTLAHDFKVLLEKNPRVDNVDIDKSGLWSRSENIFEINALLDRESMIKYNVEVNKLLEIISKNTRGSSSNNRFRINNEEVPFSVKFSNYNNIQQNDIENLILSSDGSEIFKLKNVINFKEQKVLPVINRENRQYIRYVSFDYKGPFKFGNEFTQTTINQMIIPEGYSLKTQNSYFFINKEEETDILKIIIISIFLIFIITAGLFESVKKPLIIILAIPFALVGTVLLFYLFDFSFDRGAYAGLLLLIGLSVNNSVILIDYLNKNNLSSDIKDLAKVSFNRIRPIFTTTITTIVALLPFIINTEQTFWKSFSLSVIGGIFLSAFFVVIIIPIIYLKKMPLK